MSILHGAMLVRQQRITLWNSASQSRWLKDGLIIVHNCVLNGLANIFVHNRLDVFDKGRSTLEPAIKKGNGNTRDNYGMFSASCWLLCFNGRPSHSEPLVSEDSTFFRQAFFDFIFALELVAMVRRRFSQF